MNSDDWLRSTISSENYEEDRARVVTTTRMTLAAEADYHTHLLGFHNHRELLPFATLLQVVLVASLVIFFFLDGIFCTNATCGAQNPSIMTC